MHAAPLGPQPGGWGGPFRDQAYSEDSECKVWLVLFVNNTKAAMVKVQAGVTVLQRLILNLFQTPTWFF